MAYFHKQIVLIYTIKKKKLTSKAKKLLKLIETNSDRYVEIDELISKCKKK